MSKTPQINRPPFEAALYAWKMFLQQRAMSNDLVWIFDENLCFEKDPSKADGFHLGFQTTLTPPPPDAERIAYEYFSRFAAPVIFYRLGGSQNKSVCLLLCDEWFRGKGEREGFWLRDDWGLAWRPGGSDQIEQITDEARWKNRIVSPRPLHDLDFCMDLRAVHEILAHGRVLSTYEHYALKLLHVWRQIFRERNPRL
jgi:hypothetical protein